VGLTNQAYQEKLATTRSDRTESEDRFYDYDPAGHRLTYTDARTITPTGGTPTATRANYTYGYDVHGSVSALLDDGTGTSGTTAPAVKAVYGYLPYGTQDGTLSKGDTFVLQPTNSYRYTAKRIDPGSKTVDMGARRYTVETGRFYQADKYYGATADLALSTDPVSGNRYALAAGTPLGFIETDGHVVAADGGGASSTAPREAACGIPGHCGNGGAAGLPERGGGSAPREAACGLPGHCGDGGARRGSGPAMFEEAAAYIWLEIGRNVNSRDITRIKNLRAGDCSYEGDRFVWCLVDPNYKKIVPYILFGRKVCKGCDWDQKNDLRKLLGLGTRDWDQYLAVPGKPGYRINYDIWSNIHFGYIGRAAGFGGERLQTAANLGKEFPELERWFGTNDPGDRVSIQIGIDLYRKYKPDQLTPEIIERAVKEAIPTYESVDAIQLYSPS
jgi:RHS repeat-associated protein